MDRIFYYISYMQLETRGENSDLNEYMKNNALNILESSANMYQVNLKTKVVGEAKAGHNNKELVDIKKIINIVELLNLYFKDKKTCNFDSFFSSV